MLKKLLVTAMASISLASAGTLVLDNFQDNQGPISTGSTGPLALTSPNSATNRTLTLNQLSSIAPPTFNMVVSSGILDMTNGTGDDSTMIVTYTLPAGLIPVGATNIQLTLEVIQSDGNPTSLALSGAASGNFSIAANTNLQTVTFNIASLGAGSLTMTMDGAAGWDLALDSIGVNWTDPTTVVPEPSTYAMIGLGLAGLAFLRRK